MRHLIVLLAIWIGVSYSSTTERYNITFGESIDAAGLIKLGRKFQKPMLTLAGMAIQNHQNAMHPCGGWTSWSLCSASIRGYFGSQTRNRSCNNTENSDMKTESDYKLCEGGRFCPVSYSRTNNGFCIKLNTTRVTNDVAVEQCKQEGGFLIHIDSQAKHDDVKLILSGLLLHVHIDGRRKDLTSPWEYQYGSKSSFLNWHLGYPRNNADDLCLAYHISTDTRFDYICSFSRPFICEIPNV